MTYTFANILFSGVCNAKCPYCIGKQIKTDFSQNNLDIFPLKNLDDFITKVNQNNIKQISFTGTNTDPQLYKHEKELISYLRENIDWVKISLHTNWRMALYKMENFNLYDRASISLPSFEAVTYEKMMWVKWVIDLQKIYNLSKVPIKISCIVTEDNACEIENFLSKCLDIGIKRIVLRKLYNWWYDLKDYIDIVKLWLEKIWEYYWNWIYNWKWIEITLWDFDNSDCKSLNLFSNWIITDKYLLV